ncbi:DegT/DnrJ/EryC1/StrS family aminotransferase [Aureibaculum sp. 2210JD6-5]|uniref:DegT/DnrJ/EryC1/StrS family aminotransferase n=1 Tax=Aureibaculum sp. 2210JD6-5 TaxID=3103957 RepID=UPI002AAE2E29|nr:DegT/DnrJ/EryC1/StrS family aminotransferase [Aureibaculum sp. 2210JD6-5]MDY7394189.1 DegT/DnrJ/EryC1/StrS family aminotransferase [Aureibaculum sp. 2210JD6-5]
MKEKIWLSSPHLTGEEKKYVKQAFDDNWVAPLGPNVNGLEQDICNYTGTASCAALSSGTAAIHLALILLGIEENDEVICSTFTFSASANPIRYQKAIPIFVDSEKETWNMCPLLLEDTIKDRIGKGKKPKAIILVHLYGMPAKMDEILKVASKYEIPIIEDAAEALGAFYKNKAMGTFGELGIFSFNGNKIITTSGGGALVSDNPEYCKKATFLATQARDDAPHYEHSHIGYNYRMSNILAGIGRGQLEVLDDRVSARRKVFDNYVKSLKDIKEIRFLEEPKDTYANRWLTTIFLDNYEQREKIRLALEAENIESRPLWKPMHLQPIFKDYPKYVNGVSEGLFIKGLCLPSGSNLSNQQQQRVIDSIRKLF